MSAPIRTILHTGTGGIIVEIECHLSNSLPGIIIVGLGNKAVDEARERVRSAFASSAIELPRKRIIINLAPADTPKESTSFDIAIALAILQSSGLVRHELDANHAVIGELGLGGNVRPVRGIIGKLLIGKKLGMTKFFIPAENLDQALLVPGVTVIPVQTLAELYAGLNKEAAMTEHRTDQQRENTRTMRRLKNPLLEVIGQTSAKRALQIAAAGRHNILLNGPPGTGKSMLAKCIPYLLPPMSHDEMLEVTHLHSLTGIRYDQLIQDRPFRAPHHSASHIAMVGGGSPPRPGEISLAHNGVLFLDELPEFNRQAIEALRQPLEEHSITIARAKETVVYPANFILVATANPCPCGYYGTTHTCECSPVRIQQYQQRLSGPLMDRVDLYVNVEAIDHQRLLEPSTDTAVIDSTSPITRAYQRQLVRFAGSWPQNGTMSNEDIKKACIFASGAKALIDEAAQNLALSARSYMRVLRVARTIADLEDSDLITSGHISEALHYRPRRTAPQ